MTTRRLRLTRRGRILAAVTLVAATMGAAVAVRMGIADVGAPGLTAGAAVVLASPSPSASPSPAGPSWRPAVATAIADAAPAGQLVTRAPVVVVANTTDRLDRDVAAWLAARLQAPVVAGVPAPPSSATSPASDGGAPELPPGTELVVAVGHVMVPDGTADVRRVLRPGAAGAASAHAGPVDVRRLDRVAGAAASPYPADLTAVEDLLADAAPAEPTDVLLLARPGEVPVADVATAFALGHRVLITTAADPRGDPAIRDALADAGEGAAVAFLGAGWDDVDRAAWTWQLAVARRGLTLPGGGQLVFPGRMIVALYGHPDGPALGVLGEQPLAETLERAAAQAAAYEPLADVPVVPALEIIATVASAGAGPRGDYSRRTAVDQLRPYVDAARDAGVFVILDLQPGRADFLSQAEEYEELLREPHVGLALDPEWRLGPNDRHLVRIGSVGAAEVNTVVTWLADLTRREALPQKLLVLHQFKHSMIRDRAAIDTSRDELAMVLHVDGQGGQPAKLATYASLQRELSPDIWIGWKNFHDEDRPMRTEAETMTLDPLPVLVTYQ